MIQHFHSTDPWHHQIEQDHVDLLWTGLNLIQSVFSILRSEDGPAVFAENPGATLPHDLLIIDNKNVYLIRHLNLYYTHRA